MPSLKITRATGDVVIYEITPVIEAAFESYFKMGVWKKLREEDRQTDWYWLAHAAMKENKEDVTVFGDDFFRTLKSVDYLPDDPAKKE